MVWIQGLCTAWALSPDQLLPANQAFKSSQQLGSKDITFIWDVAQGYHLYQNRLKFRAITAGLVLGQPDFPQGLMEHDDAMGPMEVYRGHVEIRVPILERPINDAPIEVEVIAQGCADAGICYPPQRQALSLVAPPEPVLVAAASADGGFGDVLKSLGLKSESAHGDLLPPDQAFVFYAEGREGGQVWVSFRVAKGYYLYREKFSFDLTGEPGTRLGAFEIPRGEPKQDPEFGQVEVFHQDVAFVLPVEGPGRNGSIELTARYQGCADRGVCYPPMEKKLTLDMGATKTPVTTPAVEGSEALASPAPSECSAGSPEGFVETEGLSEQCDVVSTLKHASFAWTLVSFLGMGLLLAFTPCIFPMIPILSGIIVGHGHKITTGRAFVLSLSYVLASALAYTMFGVMAGLFGHNLQAMLQEPWIIGLFCGVFVVLALSMFDLLSFQLPAFLQSRLAGVTGKYQGGSVSGAALMGGFSALIVGPCVAAPLAGALIYIGQTGDALLGGAALFCLGLGMGLPLLVIGASAGKLLPRAGEWMNSVKAVFGVGLLVVAIWLMGRIVPVQVTMVLYALLMMITAIYMGALDGIAPESSGWKRLWKGLGIVFLVYGILMLVGVAANSEDPLQPLKVIRVSAGTSGNAGANRPGTEAQELQFKVIHSLAELNHAVKTAVTEGRPVMLDFYADWCVSCKEMEHYTYRDPEVIKALEGWMLLKADVTENTESDIQLMRHFGLVGPPATLFFGLDGNERKPQRVIGYMDAKAFMNRVRRVAP